MKWPFVSRARYELLEQQFAECNRERVHLLEMVLNRDPEPKSESAKTPDNVMQFDTPFDSLARRFDASGTKDAKYRARMR